MRAYVSILLIVCFVFLPVFTNPAHAMGKKTKLAVIEVYDRSPSKDLALLRHKLESSLIKSKRVSLVPSKDIVAYFKQSHPSKNTLTHGDLLYNEALDLYYAFKSEQALEIVSFAINELKRKPGFHGSLIKAYLLKTQCLWEMDKNKDAIKSMELAVSHDLGTPDLDEYQYSPKIRRLYQKIRARYLNSKDVADMSIYINGNKKAPIYVNGVFRGIGPKLNIKVPVNMQQIVSTGARTVKSSAKNSNTKVALSATTRYFPHNKKSFVGIKSRDATVLVSDAQNLGKVVGADRIILASLDTTGDISNLKINVVDVKTGLVTPAKAFEIIDIKDDAESAANKFSKYITKLSKYDFDMPDNMLLAKGKAKGSSGKKMGSMPIIIGGGIAAAIGIGLAIGLAGGKSSTTESVSVSVSGPVVSQ